jgi:DNA-binding IclR family transcriptional regulator
LASLGDEELRKRVPVRLESFTESTVVSRADLEAELQTVRERGWASVCEELELGLNAIGAPIYDASGEVVAALSVSGPSYRLGADAFEDIAKRTIAAAESISRRLGHI